MIAATTTTTTDEPQAAAHGSVTFLPENDELAAEETVEIVYTPPEGLFDGADSLLYCGGFNGWDGEEDGVTMPMMPVGNEGKFRISINVPNFARVSVVCSSPPPPRPSEPQSGVCVFVLV